MKFTHTRKAMFLEALEEGVFVKVAAARIGMSESGVYKIRRKNASFRAAWEASAEIGDRIKLGEVEAEIRRRAVDGVPEPVFYQGRAIGAIKRFSDQLLRLMAMRLDPRYRERFDHQHSGTDGAPLNLTVEFVGMDEQADESGNGS
jgi:hypothetical protein